MESLYPFLYSDTSDLSAVLDQVRASTVAKAAEIVELRRAVGVRDGARIAECARQAAARFGAGGRLFAFGNGGSATDAQQLATLFLNPAPSRGGNGAPPLPAFGLANDTSVVTALCNDVGGEVVFARQLAAFGGRNDIAVGLSTSGNSGNLLRAFDEASRRASSLPKPSSPKKMLPTPATSTPPRGVSCSLMAGSVRRRPRSAPTARGRSWSGPPGCGAPRRTGPRTGSRCCPARPWPRPRTRPGRW